MVATLQAPATSPCCDAQPNGGRAIPTGGGVRGAQAASGAEVVLSPVLMNKQVQCFRGQGLSSHAFLPRILRGVL